MLWTTLLFATWWSAKFLLAPALLTADRVSVGAILSRRLCASLTF
jgi:hypothetical protein